MDKYYLDHFMDSIFEGVSDHKNFTAPAKPHNIYYNDENTLVFEVAANGAEKEDISIVGKDQVLSIKINNKEDDTENRNYVVNKLSTGKIELNYQLHDSYDMDQVDVKLSRGILTVTIPVKESSKPKDHSYKIK